VFPSDDHYSNSNTIFGVREKLIMKYQQSHDASELPDEL
jgi:hypothetical protein